MKAVLHVQEIGQALYTHWYTITPGIDTNCIDYYGFHTYLIWIHVFSSSFLSVSGHQMASQSLGATLSAVMCGGALEVLLLATACSDEMLRACAFEAGG